MPAMLFLTQPLLVWFDEANCYIAGSGSVTGSGTTGGLVGIGKDITSCYSNINVVGKGNQTGGLMGSIFAGATIAFSYITGNVTSNSGNVGLFAGSDNTTIKSSYATGSLTKNGTIINGFFQGAGGATLTSLGNSSFYKNTSGKYVFI